VRLGCVGSRRQLHGPPHPEPGHRRGGGATLQRPPILSPELTCNKQVTADRVCANGDVGGAVGTYPLALMCHQHQIPFYVVVQTTAIDVSCPTGKLMMNEDKGGNDVRSIGGAQVVPQGVKVVNPAFDITPAEFVSAVVTEEGVCTAPYDKSFRTIVEKARERVVAAAS
jgi:methylthioribose-1-phosphate isomerase